MLQKEKACLRRAALSGDRSYYICIVCAKYQRASVKALVQVDFLMYALSNKHKHNPYLIGNENIKAIQNG